MALSSTTVISGFARTARAALSLHNLMRAQSLLVASFMLIARHSRRRDDVYNILWAVVFGFATLNILTLAARRFEPNRRGLSLESCWPCWWCCFRFFCWAGSCSACSTSFPSNFAAEPMGLNLAV